MSDAPHLTPARVHAIFERLSYELRDEQYGDIMPALELLCGWATASATPKAPMTREQAIEEFFKNIRDAAQRYINAKKQNPPS